MAENDPVPSKWGDLVPRILSAIVLSVIGLGAVWMGGMVFAGFVVLVVGLISWEITRICAPGRSDLWVPFGALAGVALYGALILPGIWAFLLLFGVVLVAAGAIGAAGDRPRQMLYLGWVLAAGWGLVALRAEGMAPVFWLVAVVVATDIAGYFVGRIVGGPKFWPRVSPKKTWSGTAAGWIAAALVGFAFVPTMGTGVIWLSVLTSFASQMGDAAESALKRSKGIKDASALIPGHGGLFDRFDAMMGAALVITLARLAGWI